MAGMSEGGIRNSKLKTQNSKHYSGNRFSVFGSGGVFGEVFQHGAAYVLAFLGVELGGHDVVLPDGGDEGVGIVGGGSDDGGVGRDDMVGVDEVDVAVLREA